MNTRSNKSTASGMFTSQWGIDSIVGELRGMRQKSPEHRPLANQPPKLPSHKALVGIVDGLSAALFPNRLGLPELTEEGVDYFVGHTLDVALQEFSEQVQRELQFCSDEHSVEGKAHREQAAAITREFGALACHSGLAGERYTRGL